MHSPNLFHRSRRAWTLLEIMIVVVIIALLCLGAWRAYSIYRDRGEFAACKIRIANFGKGLQSYILDQGQWPQEDVLQQDGKAPDEDQLWDWWYKQLKPHGIGPDDWYCPTDIAIRDKERKMEEEKGDSSRSKYENRNPSYIPAKFGQGPAAPYEVANHPWAIERTGHRQGMNKVMPNGSVQTEFNFKSLPKNARGEGQK